MATREEIERALAAIAATLNEQELDEFETGRVQRLLSEAVGGTPKLAVDDGGGLHDESGARIGAIRRTPSGEWISERQNEAALRSEADIPAKPPESWLKKVTSRLRF